MKNIILFATLILFSACQNAPVIKHKRGEDADKIAKYYEQNNSEALKCFEGVKTKGQLTLKWRLNSKRQVLNPQVVDDEILNSEVNDCLIDHLKTLEFPATLIFSEALIEYTYKVD
ncbi:MAG: hypothetical protein MK008_01470 [Bdellovibrionales bacterium]|nr:hypothetical protein [Bdellovibrionales bacterium]